LAFCHLVIGIIGLGDYCTVLAAVPLLSTFIVLAIGAWRQEAGDGGRGVIAATRAAAQKEKEENTIRKGSEKLNENWLETLVIFSHLHSTSALLTCTDRLQIACPVRTFDKCLVLGGNITYLNPGDVNAALLTCFTMSVLLTLFASFIYLSRAFLLTSCQ
jgi:hypothetical protein